MASPTYRLYCKSQGPEGDYCATVRDGKLCLARPKNGDSSQLWLKENSYNIGDMLVSKSDNKVIKHSKSGDQLKLVPKPQTIDLSILWTESAETGPGYRFLTAKSDTDSKPLVMDAQYNEIKDGTFVITYPNKMDNPSWSVVNQLWKLVPAAVYVYKDTDSFKVGVMLVNRSSGKVVKHSKTGVQLQLVDKPSHLDKSVLWSESADFGSGYRFMKTLNDSNYVMDAWTGIITDGTIVSTYENVINKPHRNVDNQLWKLAA